MLRQLKCWDPKTLTRLSSDFSQGTQARFCPCDGERSKVKPGQPARSSLALSMGPPPPFSPVGIQILSCQDTLWSFLGTFSTHFTPYEHTFERACNTIISLHIAFWLLSYLLKKKRVLITNTDFDFWGWFRISWAAFSLARNIFGPIYWKSNGVEK